MAPSIMRSCTLPLPVCTVSPDSTTSPVFRSRTTPLADTTRTSPLANSAVAAGAPQAMPLTTNSAASDSALRR